MRLIAFGPESKSIRWNASSARYLECGILRFIIAWKAAILSIIECCACENELSGLFLFVREKNSILSFCALSFFVFRDAGFQNLSLQSVYPFYI